MQKKIIAHLHMVSILFLCLHTTALFSQDVDQYRLGIKFKNESKFPEAFAIFQQLLKKDSNNIDYLTNASFLYSKIGWRQKTEALKQSYYHTAEYLAIKAISKNDKNADAHFMYAFALGRINEFASNKTKIANAKLIKTECDKTIALNPKIPGIYHILGRWHKIIAGFNMVEQMMINAFFGGVPEGGTYEDAIANFTKAIQFEPTYILHQYELADTYYERDNDKDRVYAKVWLTKAVQCPILNVDDEETKAKCLALLKRLE